MQITCAIQNVSCTVRVRDFLTRPNYDLVANRNELHTYMHTFMHTLHKMHTLHTYSCATSSNSCAGMEAPSPTAAPKKRDKVSLESSERTSSSLLLLWISPLSSLKDTDAPVQVKQEPVEEGKDGNVLAAEDFTHGGVRKVLLLIVVFFFFEERVRER